MFHVRRGRRAQLAIFSTFNNLSALCAIFADISSFFRHRLSDCITFASWLLGGISTGIQLAACATCIDGAQLPGVLTGTSEDV